jgi:DNA-binding FadR family transcriptional regulator
VTVRPPGRAARADATGEMSASAGPRSIGSLHPDGNGGVSTKRASLLARRIEDDVLDRRLPVGTVVGSEADLLERFDVSRAVLREAVRIVEHDGLAEMRRGPGGGLIVRRPDPRTVAMAAGIWFSHLGVTVGELMETRMPLQTTACRLAADRIDEYGVERLRQALDEVESHSLLDPAVLVELDLLFVELAGNPAITLFSRALAEITASRLTGTRAKVEPALTEADARTHFMGYRRLAEAIIEGDGGLAQARMRRLIEAVAERLRDREVRPRRRPPDLSTGKGKLAERLAATIRDDIERAGWPVGTVLGSEADLVERYGVSRAIFREAVRVLEHHNALRTRRGPGGGIIVAEPDGRDVARAGGIALEFSGVTVAQLLEARAALEISGVKLASERCTPEIAGDLRRALDAEADVEGGTGSFHDLHLHLARATGNRPLLLFVDVLADITNFHLDRDLRNRRADLSDMSDTTRRAHVAIVEAIIAGDAALAQHRMARHIDALVQVLT